MNTLNEIKKSDIIRNDDNTYTNVVVTRFENLMKELVINLGQEVNPEAMKQLVLSDNQFILDIFSKSLSKKAISEPTPEKKRLERRILSRAKFFDNVRDNGGVFTSAEVAKLLGVTKVTVKKKKDTNKLLALNFDGEFVYPVFQFSLDNKNSQKGVLRGVSEIMSSIARFSDVMKYGFFVQERNLLNSHTSEEYTIVEILKKGVSDEELNSIIRLSKTFGTQDPA